MTSILDATVFLDPPGLPPLALSKTTSGTGGFSAKFVGSLALCAGACVGYRAPVGNCNFLLNDAWGYQFHTDPLSFNTGHYVHFDSARGVWRSDFTLLVTATETWHQAAGPDPDYSCTGAVQTTGDTEVWFMIGCNPPAFSLTLLVPIVAAYSCPLLLAIYHAPMRCSDGTPFPGIACGTLFSPSWTIAGSFPGQFFILWPSEYAYTGNVDLVC